MPIHFAAETIPLSYNQEGVIHVGTTRIPLDTVIAAFQEGATAEEIVQQYPSLQLPDVYQVIGFYLRQPSEIDDYLSNRKVQSDTIRKANEIRFDPHGIRDRLLSRRRVTSV